MAQKCLLFVYGLLQPAYSPPRSLSNHWRDRIKATLYDLGAYPGAVRIGQGSGWIEGTTLEIDADELQALDEFEDVESGEFRRVLVETESGHTAWVYEYMLQVPSVLAPVEKWQK